MLGNQPQSTREGPHVNEPQIVLSISWWVLQALLRPLPPHRCPHHRCAIDLLCPKTVLLCGEKQEREAQRRTGGITGDGKTHKRIKKLNTKDLFHSIVP